MTVGARAGVVSALLPVPAWDPSANKRDKIAQMARYPGGSARWHMWRCENKAWRVFRSQRVVGGTLHGRYIVLVLQMKPGDDQWTVVVERTFSTRKAAIKCDDTHYGRHSPKWRALQGTHGNRDDDD